MSTRARIGLLQEDLSVLSVYHHWDGYPEWLGGTLKEQYNTREKIAKLIDGVVDGDNNSTINKRSKIESGDKNSLSFLGNSKYNDFLYKSSASIVIVKKSFELNYFLGFLLLLFFCYLYDVFKS